eukprot:Trichotokara_eunicae@DN6128_c0_g1_i1.p1
MMEHLGESCAPVMLQFLDPLIRYVADADSTVRQAACYGMVPAAKLTMFDDKAVEVANLLVRVVTHADAEKKANRTATDNAVAGLGSVILHKAHLLGPDVEAMTQVWLKAMPLKSDEAEGEKVHGMLVDQIVAENPIFLGSDGRNLPVALGVLTSVFKTQFSNKEVDEKIKVLFSKMTTAQMEEFGKGFNKKQKKGLQKIVTELATPAPVVAA